MPPVPLVPLTVVVGDEDLLVGRAVSTVVRAARERDPDVDVRDLTAAELQHGDLSDALSPSLFGERRVLVVRAAQDLAKDVAAELLACLDDPQDEVHVVVLHAGGAKGKALLTSLLARSPRRVDAPKVTKPGERRDFVRRELKADGRIVEEEAVLALVEAVGTDLRELASAAGQLLADHDGPLTVEVVTRYHRGRAESSGFTVADRAVDGDLAGALELARWGQSTGLAPVLVTSALASTLRSMALVASAGRVPAHQIAGQLGMPPWKVEKTQRQARGWRPEGLSAALAAVARADADVKGAAADQGYAVERVLLAVVEARQAGR
ncbi:MAG: DNA polymerase III delta subunit [uncultured Frankineae bacterium]|uniref:DNA-directed DNA polymerase n=1 Tax=uncultured Frankineae bacterium TaxID=437475 RepID=A0A6J4M8P8_9ACTN|nr:MAG: DNA polymerase III delta subunit [uncultured Frankineae bacterium]